LFLVDVGVRRVRIDLRAIALGIRKALSKQRRSSEQHVGALRAAKEKTQELLAERGAGVAAGASGGAGGAGGARPARSATASVKFEASAEALRRPAPSPITPARPAAEGAPGAVKPAKTDAPAEEEQGM